MIDVSNICAWVDDPCGCHLTLLDWQRGVIGNLCNINEGETDIIALLEEIRDELAPVELTTISYVSPANIVDTVAVEAFAAPGVGSYYEINAITISNSSVTVGTLVNVLSGSTVIWSGPAATNFGGYSISFEVPLRTADNEAINIQCVTTGAAVRASVQATSRTA